MTPNHLHVHFAMDELLVIVLFSNLLIGWHTNTYDPLVTRVCLIRRRQKRHTEVDAFDCVVFGDTAGTVNINNSAEAGLSSVL